MEGQGDSKIDCTEIVTNADSLNSSVIFHAINDISGFVLFMHQQIPSMLQDISFEFDRLCSEREDLRTDLTEKVKPSMRRKNATKLREVKQGIRKFEKLVNAVSEFRTAVEMVISQVPNIQGAILVLGPNPIRPQHVYELHFSHGKCISEGPPDFSKSKAAEALSRKAIRALISDGAGSGSYLGPSKLFLLIKAPASFCLPVHFLPKRDFKYSKKIVPFRLRFKCKTKTQLDINAPDFESPIGNSTDFVESSPNEYIWFQCRHVIKGLECNVQPEE